MAKSPTGQRSQHPPKQIIRDGFTIDFKKTNPDVSSGIIHYYDGKNYCSTYPSVYSVEMPRRFGYSKIYNFFPDVYFENKGFINYRQFSLYVYILTLRNRGYYLSLKGSSGGNKITGPDGEARDRTPSEVLGLAKLVGRNVPDLTADLDHLENCMLLHRVRRMDLQGFPDELVIHTPFYPDPDGNLLPDQEKLIWDRIKGQVTQKAREPFMVEGEKNGQKYRYLDRQACRQGNPSRWLDYGFITEAFGEYTRRFVDFAFPFFIDTFNLLETDKQKFDRAYRQALWGDDPNHATGKFTDWNIGTKAAREKAFIAANKFRRVYCPLDSELYA